MATLDKSWMDIGNRLDPNYIRGVETFLDFAFQHTKSGNLIYCPCRKCFNGRLKTRDEVREDLIISGILRGYTYWDHHGEYRHATTGSEDDELELHNEVECDEIDELIADTLPGFNHENVRNQRYETETTSSTIPQNEAERILRVIQNAKASIYPGCEISKLKKDYYDIHETDEERLQNRPPFVKEKDWKWLIKENWGTSKVKEEIQNLSVQREEELNSLDDDHIFTQVFGPDRSRRVRCRGHGITPTSENGTSNRFGSQAIEKVRREIEIARKEAAEAKQELADYKKVASDEMNKMKDDMAMMMQTLRRLIDQNNGGSGGSEAH